MVLAFFLILFLQCTLADVDAPCYFPTGNLAPGYFPCDPTAPITQCCPTGWTCFSNNLCVVTDPSAVNSTTPIGTSIRGACTNPKWNNAVCGDFCLDNSTTDGKVQACGNNFFCCVDDQASGKCNCTDDSGAFSVGSGVAQTIIGITGLSNTATPSLSTVKSTSGISSTSSTASTASTTNSNSSTPSKESSVKKPGVLAGIIIGAIVGASGLVAAVYFLWRRCLKSNGHESGGNEPGMIFPFVDMKNQEQPHQDPAVDTSKPATDPSAQSNNPYQQDGPSTTNTNDRWQSGTLMSTSSSLNMWYDNDAGPNRSMSRTPR